MLDLSTLKVGDRVQQIGPARPYEVLGVGKDWIVVLNDNLRPPRPTLVRHEAPDHWWRLDNWEVAPPPPPIDPEQVWYLAAGHIYRCAGSPWCDQGRRRPATPHFRITATEPVT